MTPNFFFQSSVIWDPLLITWKKNKTLRSRITYFDLYCKATLLISHLIDLFLDSDSFYNCIRHFSSERSNFGCKMDVILDVKQLNKIMKLYYFYTLKALWNVQGKIKMYYGMSRVKKQLARKRSNRTIQF